MSMHVPFLGTEAELNVPYPALHKSRWRHSSDWRIFAGDGLVRYRPMQVLRWSS